ncbi:MAG: DMT family transporter [Spirochaetales bacterium]|nr:DMT family transporter [Spirochaetales bacterium]
MSSPDASRSRALAGAALIVYSAFGFGLIPIFALYTYAGGINVPTLLLIRFALAAPLLFAAAALRRRSLAAPPASRPWLLLVGLCYTLQSGTYFAAVRYIPVAMATLILYSYPALVCLLSVIVERARISGVTFAALALSLAGVVLVLGASFRGFNLIGALLALAAALVYSVYITLSNRLLRTLDPLPMTAYVCLFSAGAYALFGAAAGVLDFGFAASTWLPIAALILVSTVGGIVAFFAGLRRLGSTRAALLSMIEPPITIGFSVLLFGERLSPWQVVGAVLVLAGAVWVTLSRAGRR